MIYFLKAAVHDGDEFDESVKEDRMLEEVEEEGIGLNKLVDVQFSNPVHIPACSSG